LAVPAEHALASKPEVTVDDIQDQPFVFLGDTHSLCDSIDKFCNKKSFQPIGTTRIQQLVTVQNLVAMGYGMSFVPQMATSGQFDKRIVYRKLSGWNPYRYQGQLLKNFIESVREFCGGFDFGGKSSSDVLAAAVLQAKAR